VNALIISAKPLFIGSIPTAASKSLQLLTANQQSQPKSHCGDFYGVLLPWLRLMENGSLGLILPGRLALFASNLHNRMRVIF
jgi:hypothetical protein